MDDPNNQPKIQKIPDNQAISQPTEHPESGMNTVIQPSAAFVDEMKSAEIAANPPTQPTPINLPQTPQPQPINTPIDNPSETADATQNLVGITGSQLKEEKTKTPIGIYIIVAVLVVGFIINFFNTNTSLIQSLFYLIDLLLAAGLLLRKEIIRKIMIIISLLTIVLSVIYIVGLILIFNLAQRDAARAQSSLQSLQSRPNLTLQQESEVNAAEASIKKQQKTLGKTYDIAYLVTSIEIIAHGALVIYLTRPKVREVFTK